jgi:hypothetical protein
VAIGVPQHAHHLRALGYWHREAAADLVFCRHTSLGLLRILTSAAPMAGQPLTVADAWHAYRRLRALPEVSFAPEPRGCETVFERWLSAGRVTSRLWADACLAAFAVAAGCRLVSFDRDFGRLPDLDFLLLQG